MIDIERSQPAPESLSAGKTWRGEDVKARLREDFLGKCYLCEGKLRRAFDVEHRQPRSAGGEPFAWDNLFPAHHDCNIGRPAYPSAGLLNPGQGIERRLRQWLDADNQPCFVARTVDDPRASNTAHELSHLHRGSSDAASDLRESIVRQLAHVLKLVEQWLLSLGADAASARTHELGHELHHQLSRRAPYTSLIRSKIDRRILRKLEVD